MTNDVQNFSDLCTDCLSANQIKRFVAYFSQYTVKIFIYKLHDLTRDRARDETSLSDEFVCD